MFHLRHVWSTASLFGTKNTIVYITMVIVTIVQDFISALYFSQGDAVQLKIGKPVDTLYGRLNKKDGLTRYGDSHVKDKTS